MGDQLIVARFFSGLWPQHRVCDHGQVGTACIWATRAAALPMSTRVARDHISSQGSTASGTLLARSPRPSMLLRFAARGSLGQSSPEEQPARHGRLAKLRPQNRNGPTGIPQSLAIRSWWAAEVLNDNEGRVAAGSLRRLAGVTHCIYLVMCTFRLPLNAPIRDPADSARSHVSPAAHRPAARRPAVRRPAARRPAAHRGSEVATESIGQRPDGRLVLVLITESTWQWW